MNIVTFGELLHWSYANLAMAYAALTNKATHYGQTHFIIRNRLYNGLRKGSMHIGPMADDKRLKMILSQACCYCGNREHLAAGHLIPRKKGSADTGDNLVWACRACNNSKCATDALEWFAKREQFPPLLLFRRYLKLALEFGHQKDIMNTSQSEVQELPFTIAAIPRKFPQPTELQLWITDL